MVLALTLVYSCFAALCAPADDEFYYWCWAQQLQWSYYDHPVMTALMIRGSGTFLGHNLIALRMPACLTSAIVFAIILHLTQPRKIAWWLLVTPLFSIGACIVTPDTPLLLFWAAYLLWLIAVHSRLADARPLTLGFWTLGGVLLGCGVLGKYTMALAVPAGFLSFLLAGTPRRWLAGYLFHGVVSFVVTLPILIFNIQHDFVPILYQWTHSMGTPNPGLRHFGDFVGLQMLLFGTAPLVLLPWVLWNWRSLAQSPRLRVCLCLYGFPFAFFLWKATRGHLEGNWALASYIGFWPLAAEWHERRRGTFSGKWGMRLSFLPAGLASLGLTVHTLWPIPVLSPASDRVTRQAEKNRLAAQMAADLKRLPPGPVFVDTYQWVALLRFHGVDARQFAGMSRPSHFTQSPETPTDYPECYILWSDILKPVVKAGLKEPQPLAEYPLMVRGQLLTVFGLWKVERR